MSLNLTLRISMIIYVLGAIACWILPVASAEQSTWYLVGGGLAIINISFAAWVIRFGLASVRSKAIFLGLLLMKSFTSVAVVAVILMVLKPLLLPFTLGLCLVIVSAVLAAMVELNARRRRT